jgi:hypothetical protein
MDIGRIAPEAYQAMLGLEKYLAGRPDRPTVAALVTAIDAWNRFGVTLRLPGSYRPAPATSAPATSGTTA